MIKKRLLTVWLWCLVWQAGASDVGRELDYAADIQRHPLEGNIVWLKAENAQFLGLFRQAERTDNTDAAIILHDLGEYPDQRPLVHELRTVLPYHNWTTLSLQMPLMEAGASQGDYYALFAEAENRITAAVAYLKQSGAKNIVVIGYGLGALMAMYAISDKPENIAALVAISLSVPNSSSQSAQTLRFIKNIALPILDVYSEFDLPEVVNTAAGRREAGKDNPVYWQAMLEGDDHSYRRDPDRLVKRVYSWLSSAVRSN